MGYKTELTYGNIFRVTVLGDTSKLSLYMLANDRFSWESFPPIFSSFAVLNHDGHGKFSWFQIRVNIFILISWNLFFDYSNVGQKII